MQMETGNRILDELPAAVQRSLKAPVGVAAGTRIYQQGERVGQVFFPTTAVCALVVELASGDKAETATVGRDGFVGVTAVLGIPVSHSSGVVQLAGEGYRMNVKTLHDLCRQHEGFRRALYGYTGFLLHVASRSVACNSFHSISQRLARWLLFAHDRANRGEFLITHEVLAAMAAATRPRVSQAAAKLKAAGIIDYKHGKVRVVERARLEAAACECYRETKRLSPQWKQ